MCFCLIERRFDSHLNIISKIVSFYNCTDIRKFIHFQLTAKKRVHLNIFNLNKYKILRFKVPSEICQKVVSLDLRTALRLPEHSVVSKVGELLLWWAGLAGCLNVKFPYFIYFTHLKNIQIIEGKRLSSIHVFTLKIHSVQSMFIS